MRFVARSVVADWAPVLRLCAGALFASPIVAAEDFDFFEKKIRPVLVENCYECHSDQSKQVKGGLRLDSREGLLHGGDSGPAIVPGDPEKSVLIKAVRYTDRDLQMPPKDKKLPDNQIADLVEWVKLGAPNPRTSSVPTGQTSGPPPTNAAYDVAAARKQWAFQPPKDLPIPKVKDTRWARSPVDRFILAKLEDNSLRPASLADKRTLIRRATFDLTGLPPTPADIDAFLADDSQDAFAKVVERLLASPQYGERWARHWLDVVRYTDSFDSRGIGGTADVPEAYRYRDWVVEAFNHDFPYDQFIVQQIAGDLIPGSEPDRFNTNGVIATGMYAIGEWGTGDADKEKMLTDIVDDQIDVTGRAFLGLTLACARCHDHKFDPISTTDYYGLAGIFFSSHILPEVGPKTAGSPVLRIPLASAEELAVRKGKENRASELEREINAKLPAMLLTKPARGQFNQPALASLRTSDGELPSAVANASETAIQFLTITLPARSVAVHPSPDRAAAAVWLSPIDGAITVGGRVADADDKCGNGIEWTLFHGQRTVLTGKFENGKEQTITNIEVTVRAGEIVQLAVMPRGRDHACDTTLVELEIRERGEAGHVWRLPEDVVGDLPTLANTGVWHFIAFAATPPATLSATNLSDADRESLEQAKTELAALRKSLERAVPVAHGLQEGGCPKTPYEGFHDARVHLRGRYDRLGEVVARGFPRVLASEEQKPITEGSGRLQLARWLASPENPLTARVMINRIWQHHFGTGIVRTPNNYGKLGEPPTHPELLDYLARRFIESGWSIKSMHRLIMLSAVYQQSSLAQPETLRADPENKLFGHMTRRRLEAEELRDTMLVVAGNLDLSQRGRAIRDLNTPRRTLYVMTVRSDRNTYQALFDAADPTAIVEQRVTSTVAPQSLFLLNHPFVLAQTKELADRLNNQTLLGDREKIEWLYRELFGRSPSEQEVQLALATVAPRGSVGNSGEPQSDTLAWEQYCHVLLCANEFVYVD